MKKLDLVGRVFNRLTVLEEAPTRLQKSYWHCQCVCGNKLDVIGSALTTGGTQSCGCLQRERTGNSQRTHGRTKTPEYYAWVNIRTRCYNKNNINYKDWGGRGIRVCDRWLESFENFYADMGKRPSAKHSIDRYPNNDGDYEPSNCRWATDFQQANNKRNIVLYESHGLKMNLQGWANYFGVHQANLMNTLKTKGIEKAYNFYYKKHNGNFPNGGEVTTKKPTINYNPKKPVIGYREGLLVVFESDSIREMSRLTGLHHARIENSVYNGVSYKGWKFELI